MFDQIVTTGLAALFGGMLLWVPIGAVVGRFQGFEMGAGTAMLLFGLTGLSFAAWLAWYLYVDSTEVQAMRVGCLTVSAETPGGAASSQDEFTIERAPGKLLALRSKATAEPCARRRDDERQTLRVPKAAMAHGRDGPVEVERITDPVQGAGLIGVFGAFGGFGFLGGGVLIASRLERSRSPREPAPVAPWREELARGFVIVGNLVFVASLLGAGFMDWSAERSIAFAFRGVAVSCACWAASMAARRQLRISTVLFFVLLGGGFYLAAASVKLFG